MVLPVAASPGQQARGTATCRGTFRSGRPKVRWGRNRAASARAIGWRIPISTPHAQQMSTGPERQGVLLRWLETGSAIGGRSHRAYGRDDHHDREAGRIGLFTRMKLIRQNGGRRLVRQSNPGHPILTGPESWPMLCVPRVYAGPQQDGLLFRFPLRIPGTNGARRRNRNWLPSLTVL